MQWIECAGVLTQEPGLGRRAPASVCRGRRHKGKGVTAAMCNSTNGEWETLLPESWDEALKDLNEARAFEVIRIMPVLMT